MALSLCRRGLGTWIIVYASVNGTAAKLGSVCCAKLERSV